MCVELNSQVPSDQRLQQTSPCLLVLRGLRAARRLHGHMGRVPRILIRQIGGGYR